MKVLVTGATGRLGRMVVQNLLKSLSAADIAVSVRDTIKAQDLSNLGIDVRYGDFNDPASLATAFKGVDKLLMISTNDPQNRLEQQKVAVKAAKEAGVSFIAYTSGAKGVQDHGLTEQAIKESGIAYCILRNNLYIENELPKIQAATKGAPWVTAAGEGKISWASRQDYAEAAANVLLGDDHNNTVYELGGKPLTQKELVAIISDVIEKEVPVQQVDFETYGKVMLGAGIPEQMIPVQIAIQMAIQAGAMDVESNDLELLLARPVTPYEVAIRQMVV
ncbi:SDR family oxidoreductase [Paenibacillus sp. BIC5C1]|uniref:SDR family oxidoreductase n=1 Tax=Paenibacillus sp. BIC5C1 TaxID=3078263 RepID=UPI0028E44F54|nr:SDR family oxidoreductase [Paenibacillus sp. BIC5C1]